MLKLFVFPLTDLSYWRGGQFQHHPSMWLQSTAELDKSAQLLDLPTVERHNNNGVSSPKEELETEWEMCRREYDARIALMMLMEGSDPNVGSLTSTVESRPAPAQLMKLLDGRDTEIIKPQGVRCNGVNWHFSSDETKIKLPQVCKLSTSFLLYINIPCPMLNPV